MCCFLLTSIWFLSTKGKATLPGVSSHPCPTTKYAAKDSKNYQKTMIIRQDKRDLFRACFRAKMLHKSLCCCYRHIILYIILLQLRRTFRLGAIYHVDLRTTTAHVSHIKYFFKNVFSKLLLTQGPLVDVLIWKSIWKRMASTVLLWGPPSVPYHNNNHLHDVVTFHFSPNLPLYDVWLCPQAKLIIFTHSLKRKRCIFQLPTTAPSVVHK